MVYYINESYDSKSINELCNEFTLFADDITHEANMAMLATKYNFICENGYEMPLNEAEEQKENILKRMIDAIKRKLKELKEKIVAKLNTWIEKHPNSKIKPFIEKIKNIFDKGNKKLDDADSAEEANKVAKETSEGMQETAEDAKKEVSYNKNIIVEADNEYNTILKDMLKDNLKSNIKTDYPYKAYTAFTEIVNKYINKLDNPMDKQKIIIKFLVDYDIFFKHLEPIIKNKDEKFKEQIQNEYKLYREKIVDLKNRQSRIK